MRYVLALLAAIAALTLTAGVAYADNDTTGTAISLTPNSGFDTDSVNDATDEWDWYEIVLPSSGWLSVFLTWDDGADDLDLFLTDSSLTNIGSSQALARDFEEVDGFITPGDNSFLSSGTYYARVRGVDTSNSDSTYRIYSVYTEEAAITSSDDHNDSPAAADRVSDGVPSHPDHHEIDNSDTYNRPVGSPVDQVDYYYFELLGSGDEEIRIEWTSSSHDLDLAVYDARGSNLLYNGTAVGGTAEEVQRFFDVGRYYIAVTAVNTGGISIGYTISLRSLGGTTSVSDCGMTPGAQGELGVTMLALLIGLIGVAIVRRRFA